MTRCVFYTLNKESTPNSNVSTNFYANVMKHLSCGYKRRWYIRERNVHLYRHTNTYVRLISWAQSPLLSDLKWEFAGCFAAAEVGRYSMPLNADQRLLAICRRIFVLPVLPSHFRLSSPFGPTVLQEHSRFSIISLDRNFRHKNNS